MNYYKYHLKLALNATILACLLIIIVAVCGNLDYILCEYLTLCSNYIKVIPFFSCSFLMILFFREINLYYKNYYKKTYQINARKFRNYDFEIERAEWLPKFIQEKTCYLIALIIYIFNIIALKGPLFEEIPALLLFNIVLILFYSRFVLIRTHSKLKRLRKKL